MLYFPGLAPENAKQLTADEMLQLKLYSAIKGAYQFLHKAKTGKKFI